MDAVVKLVFVGLVSLVNVNRTTNGIPPAVLVINAQSEYHVPFVAFDNTAVDMDGAPPETVPGMKWYSRVTLLGEAIDGFADGPLEAPLGSIASVNAVARWNGKWNGDYVPQTGRPKASAVAGLVLLGKGSLTATCPTDATWTFQGKDAKPNQAVSYSTRVEYTEFQKATDQVILKLSPLPGSPLTNSRTLAFRPRTQNGDIVIFVGNGSMNDFADLLRADCPHRRCYDVGHHFKYLHKIVNGLDAVPVPDASHTCHGDSTGYCGPDQIP